MTRKYCSFCAHPTKFHNSNTCLIRGCPCIKFSKSNKRKSQLTRLSDMLSTPLFFFPGQPTVFVEEWDE